MLACPIPLHDGKLLIDKVKHGAVCFTFDDGYYADWLEYLDLFKCFNARCTFFYDKEITAAAADSIKILRSCGHSVGFHTISHRDAVEGIAPEEYFNTQILPQINAAAQHGIDAVRYFAYPNNRHFPGIDKFLSSKFARFRAGLGLKLPKGFFIADQDKAFIPLDELRTNRIMGGCGIGEYYNSTEANLDAALERAANENKLIVFFSHDIAPGAKSVHMPSELMEHLLEYASKLQMAIIGFDELPE